MELPDRAIGISDINKYRECGRKMVYQMRRHTEGEQPPEDIHPDTMYGTIFHEAVTEIEDKDLSDEEALQLSFDRFARFLKPEDCEKLRGDLEIYHERDYTGVRTVANETEIRVPLLEWEGETIFFRGKIDRLYQRLDNPGSFIHVDYKTSKHPRSEEEVHKDTQMWAYNWSIHEYWPECESLTQNYDQLRFGVVPTRKSERQREEIREWLVRQVTAILKDEDPQASFNMWCPWCPIKESCPVIDRLSEFETARIEALLPEDQEADTDLLEVYTEKLGDVKTAIKTLKAYEDRVKAVIRELPADRREALGFKMIGRSLDAWTPEALEQAQEVLGDDFYKLVKLSKRQVTDYLKDDERLELVMALATKQAGSPQLREAPQNRN